MSLGSYLKAHKAVLSWGSGSASFPLLAYLADLQPPWPPGITPLSTLFVLIAAVVAWEFARNARRQKRRLMILWSLVVAVLAISSYSYAYSRFVDAVPTQPSARVIRGYECTAEAKLVYGTACPALPSDALENAAWEPTELWTRASITNVRLLLALAWLVFTFSVGFTVGAVVAGRKM
jgi:hypothetical protein